ncbi:DUF4012 domain-containing protein [Sinomonas terrae]|uniref:DUF4012 domain-containing protein n=1 Tax=Sinomonas terrae TaxID=2908838 RepID=A0ABS9U540_9MICC|nr:DUF4012 domain-containing protein [Sinomonas terrae]MCH6471804.1 DUF4012 domain-containing protein [Sinomonas terrae]
MAGTLVALVVIACAVWLGVRAFLAQREITASEQVAKVVEAHIAAGQTSEARDSAKQLAVHVDAAQGFVSDPVWRAAGLLPFVGTNFSTVSQLAGILGEVTHGAVLPLSDAAGNISPSTIKPVQGAVDLQALSAARPAVVKADSVLQSAYSEVARLKSGFGTIPQVSGGVERFKSVLGKAAQQVSTADTVTRVLPSALGSSGPRTYLVLFQNNAELRATGGIPGAAAEVHIDNGHITLGRQTEAKGFPAFQQPVLPLADPAKGLYGPILGEYFQDVNLTPQFPLTARLASEMWKQRFGDHTDGVLSLDPVALSYLLQATGPVHLATGETLDSSNAVELLLSDAYSKYSSVQEKDDFFATAAAAVFSKVAMGSFQPRAMLDALTRAAAEHRLLAWSPNQSEQDAITAGNLSGSLPEQMPSHGVFGVYLNDATGAKMDYYLRESYKVGGVMCRADGRPNWRVEVTLTNAAPANAATSLPDYVTGGGVYGVPPGDVKTQVNVYAPPSAIYLGSLQNGEPVNVHRDMDSGYPVAQTAVVLSPGQSVTLTFQFLGGPGAQPKPDVISTPSVNNPTVSALSLSCQAVVR